MADAPTASPSRSASRPPCARSARNEDLPSDFMWERNTGTLYKLGFNQNYYTFALILPIKIVLCSNFQRTKFVNDKCFDMRLVFFYITIFHPPRPWPNTRIPQPASLNTRATPTPVDCSDVFLAPTAPNADILIQNLPLARVVRGAPCSWVCG